MSGNSLSAIEVERRLVRLRNLERLYEAQRVTIVHLRSENKELKARIRILEARDKEKDKVIDDLKLQIAELRTIVFGKKRNVQGEGDDDNDATPPPSRTPRSRESYQRKVPREFEVTETKEYPIVECADCGGTFSEHDHATVFEEDIPLPLIPSPINLSTPSPVNFGFVIQKICSPISIGQHIFQMPRSKFPRTYAETLIVDGIS